MKTIRNSEDLKEAILALEIKHRREGLLLKEQFERTYDSLKPANLIKSTIKDLIAVPEEPGGVLTSLLGSAAGGLSSAFIVGKEGGVFRQLLGKLIQTGVSGLVSKKAPALISSLAGMLGKLKKENNEPEY
jgi:hypothetical protein